MKADNPLLDRFNEQIERMDFSVLGMTGFLENPKLAMVSGMAIGYSMAIEDVQKQIGKM